MPPLVLELMKLSKAAGVKALSSLLLRRSTGGFWGQLLRLPTPTSARWLTSLEQKNPLPNSREQAHRVGGRAPECAVLAGAPLENDCVEEGAGPSPNGFFREIVKVFL